MKVYRVKFRDTWYGSFCKKVVLAKNGEQAVKDAKKLVRKDDYYPSISIKKSELKLQIAIQSMGRDWRKNWSVS